MCRKSVVFECLLIRVSRVRTPDRALAITVFTDIGAVGTVIFLCVNMRFLTIEPEITMNCKDEVTCREIGRELVADWSQGNK